MNKPDQKVFELLRSSLLVLTALFLVSCHSSSLPAVDHPLPVCPDPGWSPGGFGLKDHTLFRYDGNYYLASIDVPKDQKDPLLQDRFAYARSQDLCTWEVLPFILDERTPASWDEAAVWAPFVFEENGIYFLFYTGVQKGGTQSILLAKSSNPSDPDSWQTVDVVIQPDHEGMIWEPGNWADFRDPFVLKIGNTYQLLYTARDQDGPIIGMAAASSLEGPWQDQGSILTGNGDAMLESPVLIPYANHYYLFYNHSGLGEQFRISSSPFGPWSEENSFSPGWAHEIWQNSDDSWLTSFLTDYSVSIRPLKWDDHLIPPVPTILEPEEPQ